MGSLDIWCFFSFLRDLLCSSLFVAVCSGSFLQLEKFVGPDIFVLMGSSIVVKGDFLVLGWLSY